MWKQTLDRRYGGHQGTPPAALLHRGIEHVEFFDLSVPQFADLRTLIDRFADEGRTTFSFHTPVVRPAEFQDPGIACFYLCENEERRERSFRLLGATLAEARRWGAEYAVTHLTYGPTDCRDAETAEALAKSACRRMAEMSAAAGVRLDIEFAAYSDGFHQADRFAEIVGSHPELGICIDIGHLFIGAALRNRDFYSDLDFLRPAARSMHLWNTKGPDHHDEYGHTPLHPGQDPGDGWIDVEKTLRRVLHNNDAIQLVFEYPVDEVSPEIQAGYDWIGELVREMG